MASDDTPTGPIEVQSHQEVVRSVDFIVVGGTVFACRAKGYTREVYLESVDEIPDEYWDRWEADDAE